MSRTYKLETTSQGVTPWHRIAAGNNDNAVYTIVVDMETASGLVDLEFAVEPGLDADTTALLHPVLQNLSGSLASVLETPITAVRLNVLALARGTIKLKVIQR